MLLLVLAHTGSPGKRGCKMVVIVVVEVVECSYGAPKIVLTFLCHCCKYGGAKTVLTVWDG